MPRGALASEGSSSPRQEEKLPASAEPINTFGKAFKMLEGRNVVSLQLAGCKQAGNY